jgi:hypothetical protein
MSTDTTDNKTPDLFVKEGVDGSATVDLPDDLAIDDGDEAPQQAATPEELDEADARAEAAEIAATGDIDPEAEAMRAAKRNKRKARKEYHRQVQTEKDVRLQNLQRQNQDLLERLSVVERKTAGADLARMDKAIEDQQLRIEFAKRKMKEATESMDGDLLASAQEMWYEARQQTENLEQAKKRMVQPDRAQTIDQDPVLQRHAARWMESNPWYNPQGKDMDSRIALTVDQALADEGWDPKTAEYWEELDNRLLKVLPNRYTDFTDEKPVNRRPRSVVTSSGREASNRASGGNSFTLSREQVTAMKDAGMWDDPDKRNRMIKRYAMEARQRNQRG